MGVSVYQDKNPLKGESAMTPRKKMAMDGLEAKGLFVEEGLLRKMVEVVVQQVLEAEVERHVGAGPYERTEERRARRNGYKARTMRTPVGELSLRLPQVREGGFRTQLFERYQRSHKALVATMQEMVVKGVSTREVSAVMEELGGFEVSAATVSQAMAELDAAIDAFFSRGLSDRRWPYLIVDARYERVRKGGHVVGQALLIVAGIDEHGRRHVLSMEVGDSEAEAFWGSVFADLKARGLWGVEMVVSDAHRGIRKALSKHLQGVLWQRCRVHFMRELLKKVSWKRYKELSRDLRSIYACAEKEAAMEEARRVATKWEEDTPAMSRCLLAGVEDTLACWHLGADLRKRLSTTNMMERVMKELKARTRKVGSFPSERSLRRLAGAVLLEMDEKWQGEEQRYLRLDQEQK